MRQGGTPWRAGANVGRKGLALLILRAPAVAATTAGGSLAAVGLGSRVVFCMAANLLGEEARHDARGPGNNGDGPSGMGEGDEAGRALAVLLRLVQAEGIRGKHPQQRGRRHRDGHGGWLSG